MHNERMRATPNPPTTPLLALLRQLTQEQRVELVRLSKTRLTYLYALGGCGRTSCKADKAVRIEAATRALNKKYQTPVVTMQQLATMCECVER